MRKKVGYRGVSNLKILSGVATGRVREGERGQGQGLLPLHENQVNHSLIID